MARTPSRHRSRGRFSSGMSADRPTCAVRRGGRGAYRARPAGFALAIAFVVFCAAVSAQAGSGSTTSARPAETGSIFVLGSVWLALSSLVCGYIDATLGMGYGTTLSPILIAGFGYSPLLVVPAVLFSQLCSGFVGALAHHGIGNVKLTPGERPFSVAMVLFACSVVGAVVAVRVATGIPEWVLRVLISLIVLTMGVMILLFRNYRRRFTWRKIVALGAVASFNKVVSGGGYGPVIVAGQIVSGIDSKNAVGVTSLAEGLTCVAGLLAYYFNRGVMPWKLALPMTVGALLSVPLAVVSVKLIPAKKFTLIVGAATLVLGLYSVYKCWPDAASWLAGQ